MKKDYIIRSTNADIYDSLTINEIINHKNFRRLCPFNGFGNTPDYWEIMFESDTPTENGRYMTIFNSEVISKQYIFYKLKKTN